LSMIPTCPTVLGHPAKSSEKCPPRVMGMMRRRQSSNWGTHQRRAFPVDVSPSYRDAARRGETVAEHPPLFETGGFDGGPFAGLVHENPNGSRIFQPSALGPWWKGRAIVKFPDRW
jgi:hypothetical protein